MPMNERQMKEYVCGLVRKVISEHGLPVRPSWQQVVKALGLPPLKEGELPGIDGTRIKHLRQIIVSSRLTCQERIEFTIFHEVIHILIDDDQEIESELHEHFIGEKDDTQKKRVLESLCQAGAAEFVMPLAVFLPVVQQTNWSVASIKDVAISFTCSPLAAAFHYTLNHPKPCCMLVCEHGNPSRASHAALFEHAASEDVLFAAYSVCNEHMKYPMPRYSVIPHDHHVHRSWTRKLDGTDKAHGFYKSGKKWPMDCEVACHGGRAYAAFFPQGNVEFNYSSEQLSLL